MPLSDNERAARYALRLQELRQERENGQAQLRALETRTRELQHTLLRIDGAIAVLEQMEEEARMAGT